jgi:ABC-2 type transport system permease protein
LAVAGLLVRGRDVGSGIWPQRRGRARARAALLSPTGLVWRLQRGALLGWAVGLLGFGIVFGAVSENIKDVQGNALEWYTQMGGTDRIVDAFRASMIGMAGMTVAIFAVQMLLRMRVDENEGTLESVLATSVSRPRWVLGHVLNTACGAVALVLVFGVSMGLAAGEVIGDPATQVREMAGAGLAQLPGIMVIGGLVVALVGLLPRWAAPISWVVLLAALLLGPLFGPSFGLPQWVQDLSPFTHVPKAPATDVTVVPLALMAVVGVGLALAGVAAIRRRDVALPA